MNIVMIVGLCLVATIMCKLIEKHHKEYAMLITIAMVSLILIMVISSISPIVTEVEKLFDMAGISDDYIKIMFKAIGICYITQLGCETCKDCGENAIASEIELAGKISLLLIALPLFSALTEIVKELIYF